METIEKTINGRTYQFTPMPAGPDGLDIYSDVMSALVPALLAFGESSLSAMLSDDIRGQFAGFGGKPDEVRTAVLGMVGDIAKEVAEKGVLSRLGIEAGRLLGNKSLRELVLRLMKQRLAIQAESEDPTTGARASAWMPVAHIEHHFAAHLEDWIPAAAWCLWANYRRAFSAPLGLLPTQAKDAMGVGRSH